MSVSNVPRHGHIRRGPMTADVLGRDFTQAGNRAVRDRRLSRRARGLLVELLSHCDGFGISIQSLVAAGPEGRDAIRAALAELEEHGYLHRGQGRDEMGRLGEVVYEITDMPEEDEPLAPPQNRRSEPAPENPTSAEPTTVNPPHKKNTSSKKISREKTISLPSSSEPTAVPAAPTGERENPATPDHKPKPVAQVPAQRGEQRQQQRQDAAPAGGTATRPATPAQTAPQPTAVPDAARRVVDAYTAALARPILPATRTRLTQQAAELLAAGLPEAWLADRARELAAKGWSDLAKHAERSTAPLPGTTPTPAAEQPERWECADCDAMGKGTPPADGLCARCRAATQQAIADLANRLAGTHTATPPAEGPVCSGWGGRSCGRPVVGNGTLCGRCGCAASAATAQAS